METNSNNNSPEQPNDDEKKESFRSQLPKFNYYWLYGLLALFLLGNLLFAGSTHAPKSIPWPVFESYLLHGDVRKLTVVNEKIAEIYIKKESLKDSTFKSVAKTAHLA